jgi:hypothetical protein
LALCRHGGGCKGDRTLLPLLDGTRTIESLREHLLGVFRAGQFSLSREGLPIRRDDEARPLIAELVDAQLKKYAEAALLVS